MYMIRTANLILYLKEISFIEKRKHTAWSIGQQPHDASGVKQQVVPESHIPFLIN